MSATGESSAWEVTMKDVTTPFFEDTIYPVLDIEEAVGLFAEAVEWRKSIT